MALNINQMRKDILLSDTKRDSGLTEPKGIVIKKDIPYGKYGVDNLLDIYYPDNKKDEKGTIINIHGGGFFYGNKEIYQYYTMFLATQDFKVMNFNYRLAPENPYPEVLEDINQLMTWVVENEDSYQIDLNNLFLVGDSAGAQLTEQYTTILTNKDYARLFDFDVPQVKVKAIALNCGVYFIGKDEPIDADFPYYFTQVDKVKNQFPVEKYLTHEFPPTYVMTCSHDFLKELAYPMVEELESHQIPVKYQEFKNKDLSELHHVFHIDQKSDIARECNLSQLNFFEEYIQ